MSKDKKTALPSSSKKLLKALGKPREDKDNSDVFQAFEQLNQLEKAYKKCSQQKKKLAFQLKDIFLLKQELNTFVDLLDQKRISPPTVEYIKKTLVELSSTLPELVEDSDAAISFNKIMSMVHALTISEQEASKIYGTILIYDTNPNSTELLKRRLSQDGHHVMVAKSYPLFENYINIQQDKGDLDLVIVDQANIKLSDIVKKLGNHDGDFFTPLILTGSEQKNQTLTELFSEGITDYLVKPFNHILLKKRVESALEKKYAFDVRQRRKKEVLKLKEKFKSALSHIQEGFVLFNPSQKLVMHNDQLLKIYTHWQECTNLEGVSLSDFLYTNTKTIESITDVSKKYLLKTEDCIELTELSSSQWYEITKNHSLLRVNSHKTEDGNIILTVRDLVETIAQEQELNFMAHHDSLTGLANRKAFNEILVKKIDEATRKKQQLAVLFLDLDGFKIINDTYGHDCGDWLLTQVAHRIKRCVRESDLVARLGGDEFSLIIHDFTSRKDLDALLERLINSVKQPYSRQGINYQVGASIGVSLFPSDAIETHNLIHLADLSMYEAKRRGKGRFIFSNEIDHR